MSCTIQPFFYLNYALQQALCSCIPVVAPVVELCDQVTLLLIVASWQYSYLVEVDPGVSNALSCFESRQVRITSWGAVNVYAHVTSREHREDKRTTYIHTLLHIYKHSPRRGMHITINVGLAQARPNYSTVCIVQTAYISNDALSPCDDIHD